MRALKLETLVERRAVGASAMTSRRIMALTAVLGVSLALASCDQKRSIYLDPGHDTEQPVHRMVHAPAPAPKAAPAADGHKS